MEKGRKIMIKAIETIWNWRLVLLALLVVLAAPVAHCQQSNTVYTTIGEGVTSASSLAIPRQIGQSFHLLSVTAYDSGGLSNCSTTPNNWKGTVQLEGSFNNSFWTPITRPVSVLNADQTKYVTGAGSFPYLRVTKTWAVGVPAACVLRIYYSGNTTGSLTTNTLTAINDDFAYSTVNTIGVGATSYTSFGASCLAGTRFTLYSISVLNGTAAALSANAKVSIRLNQFPNTTVYDFYVPKLAAGNSIVVNNGPRPLFTLSVEDSPYPYTFTYTQDAADGMAITAVSRCE